MPVLVIEDDRGLCELIEAVLFSTGLAAETIDRGDVALDRIEALGDRYDAIVLDLMVPHLNGLEILEKIRNGRPHLLSRVIVLTAVPNVVVDHFSFTPFVWRVLRKPFDIRELAATMLDCVACHAGRSIPSRETLSLWLERKAATVGARAGVVLVERGSMLTLQAEAGFPAGMTEGVFPISIDQRFPITVAYRNRVPVYLASLTIARAEYPLLLPIWTTGGRQAIAALPIASGTHAIGAIGWSYDQPQAFHERQREALVRTASECYAILDRAEPAARSRP